MLISSKTWITP